MDWTCPPNRLVIERNQVHLWRLDFRLHGVEPCLEKCLTMEERGRANKFVTSTLRDRFVITRGLLRRTLGFYLGVCPDEVAIYYNANGKPYLKEGLQFNISHSHDLAIFAIIAQDEVGVDIELMRPIVDMDGICLRFFSVAESELVLQANEGERIEKFYDIWVRKEAYIKALGGRLYESLELFRTENKTIYAQEEVNIYAFTAHQEYASVLAATTEVALIKYWNLNS